MDKVYDKFIYNFQNKNIKKMNDLYLNFCAYLYEYMFNRCLYETRNNITVARLKVLANLMENCYGISTSWTFTVANPQ